MCSFEYLNVVLCLYVYVYLFSLTLNASGWRWINNKIAEEYFEPATPGQKGA